MQARPTSERKDQESRNAACEMSKTRAGPDLWAPSTGRAVADGDLRDEQELNDLHLFAASIDEDRPSALRAPEELRVLHADGSAVRQVDRKGAERPGFVNRSELLGGPLDQNCMAECAHASKRPFLAGSTSIADNAGMNGRRWYLLHWGTWT